MADENNFKLAHFSEEGKFFKSLDSMKKLPNVPFRVAVFMYDKRYEIISIFTEFQNNSNFINKFTLLEEDNEKKLYICNTEKKQDESELYFIVYKDKRISILLSNQSKEDWKNSLDFFKAFYPFLVRIFLRSFQILKILGYVEAESGLDLIAKSYVAKRYFGSPRSEVCYEKISYKTAFDQALTNNLWIDSIWVGLENKEKQLGAVRLNRRGIFSYSGISFYQFYEKFLVKVIDFFLKSYLDILEDKSRSLIKLEPKPIKIVLSDDVFVQKESFDKLIEKIKDKLKNWGYSVLAGSGILGQIMLHDYETGSSFDLYVTSSREMYIVPQTQVTEISFNNLLAFILDNFEGEIQNAS
ncbi:MAG: hypothetical protein AABX10_00605 [Nanoarchaeota archaeon]